MRKTIIAFATVLAVGMGGITAMPAAAEGLQAPAGEMTLEGKKPARFNHQTHLALEGVTCGHCHHDGERQPLTAEAIATMTDANQLACVSCHNKEFADKKLASFKKVAHQRCKGCHKAGVGELKGPTKCSACHPKKK